jgi:hypothetical protein
LIGVAVANIGTTITLFLWSTNKSEDNRKETYAILNSIQQEMKDFHGRLEKQDAEFKGKLALQDAEFKSHILHFHQQKT